MSTTLILDMNEEHERAKLWRAIKALRGKFRFEICRYRPRRSDRQNRFYWPCFVDEFAKFLREQGEAVTDLQAHEILKHKFLRKTWIDEKTGEACDYTRSTTELDTGEFNEYLDRCAAWMADMFGFEMPDPMDYYEREGREPVDSLST